MYLRTDTNAARSQAYRELLADLGPSRAGEMYEILTEGLYGEFLRAGDIALDCGANVGRHAIGMAKAVGSSGCVHAFEPSTAILPALYDRIQQAAVSDIVRVHEVALGQEQGEAQFQVLHGALGMSGLQVRELSDQLRQKVRVEQIRVKVLPLDSVLPHDVDVRFVKLDLEGGEFHALLGGRQTLKRSRPVVVFENGRGHSAREYGYEPEHFFDLFKELGYQLFDGLGFPFTPEQWTLGSVPWQYIALPEEDDLAKHRALGIVERTMRDHGLRTQD